MKYPLCPLALPLTPPQLQPWLASHLSHLLTKVEKAGSGVCDGNRRNADSMAVRQLPLEKWAQNCHGSVTGKQGGAGAGRQVRRPAAHRAEQCEGHSMEDIKAVTAGRLVQQRRRPAGALASGQPACRAEAVLRAWPQAHPSCLLPQPASARRQPPWACRRPLPPPSAPAQTPEAEQGTPREERM